MTKQAWTLVSVPAASWHQYTALKPVDGVEMLTRSDFIEGDDSAQRFCEVMQCRVTYPVALHCIDCGSVQHFEADPWEDAGLGDECFQLEALDKRMEPWLDNHRACRYQLALPL